MQKGLSCKLTWQYDLVKNLILDLIFRILFWNQNMNQEGIFMAALTQKKFSISSEQKLFLENYRQWGFTDQSSIVREALTLFISQL